MAGAPRQFALDSLTDGPTKININTVIQDGQPRRGGRSSTTGVWPIRAAGRSFLTVGHPAVPAYAGDRNEVGRASGCADTMECFGPAPAPRKRRAMSLTRRSAPPGSH
jgi:hypothetical protein